MTPSASPRRGDIFWMDFDPARGTEQAGHRPALVISRNEFNRSSGNVVVAAITSQVRDNSPVQAILEKGEPLDKRSAVLTFQVLTVTKSRLEKYIGRLTDDQQTDVDRKICLSFGLPCSG